MARQLANYSYNGFSAPAAYAKIVELDQKFLDRYVTIYLGIWPSKDYCAAGNAPTEVRSFQLNGDLLTQALGAPQAGPSGAVPTTVGEIVVVNAYAALLQHPDAQTLLAGSTLVSE